MEYFKHDINASEDDKICELLATGGYELLGYYWRFVEYLYSRGGKVNKSKLKGVAWSLHMDVDKLLSLVNDYTLFLQEDDVIYSKRILSEVEEFEAVGKRMSEIGKAGGKASAEARAKRTVKRAVENIEADAQQNKIKEKKENKINNNIPPVVPQGDTHAPEKELCFGDFVKIPESDYKKLQEKYPTDLEQAIDFLNNYISEDKTGKRQKDYAGKNHGAVIRRWVIDAVRERKDRQPNSNNSFAGFKIEDFFEK